MLKNACIQVTNYDKLDITDTGTVWGYICLKIGDEYFPSENWDDLILTALHSWYTDFLDLQNGIIDSAHFQFFDGSYSFEIQRTGNTGKLILYNSSQKEQDEIKNIYEIDIEYMYHSYYQCLEEIIKYLERINKKVNDYIRLTNYINLYKTDEKLKKIDIKAEKYGDNAQDGLVGGCLYLNIDDVFFPRKYNYINILILLDDWFEMFLNLKDKKEISEYFPCDDTFVFEIQNYNASSKIILYRIHDEEQLIKMNEYSIDIDYLCESFFKCVENVLFNLQKIDVTDESYEPLKSKYNRYSKKYLFL